MRQQAEVKIRWQTDAEPRRLTRSGKLQRAKIENLGHRWRPWAQIVWWNLTGVFVSRAPRQSLSALRRNLTTDLIKTIFRR